MSEINLEEIKKLAELLTPEERYQLFQHLAELPDSGIKTVSPFANRKNSAFERNRQEAQLETEPQPELNFTFNCQFKDGEIIYYLDGAEIFRAKFFNDNCTSVFYEKLKSNASFLTISPEQRRRIYAGVRELLIEDRPDITDEEIQEYEEIALQHVARKLLKEGLEKSSKRVSENLPQAVALVFDKVLQAAHFSAANDLRDVLNVPEQKYRAKEIKDTLFQQEWELLKMFTGVTQGGARNIKHLWTDKERACLANHFERLKPIWAEAKRISKEARKSKESTRRQQWREEILRAYPELPKDLIERLSAPRSDEAKPTDIAITHAARLCISATYSPRRLKDEIKEWKFKK